MGLVLLMSLLIVFLLSRIMSLVPMKLLRPLIDGQSASSKTGARLRSASRCAAQAVCPVGTLLEQPISEDAGPFGMRAVTRMGLSAS